jgi:hypothetical protein
LQGKPKQYDRKKTGQTAFNGCEYRFSAYYTIVCLKMARESKYFIWKSIYRIIAKKEAENPRRGRGAKVSTNQTRIKSFGRFPESGGEKGFRAFPEKHPGGVFFNINLKIDFSAYFMASNKSGSPILLPNAVSLFYVSKPQHNQSNTSLIPKG